MQMPLELYKSIVESANDAVIVTTPGLDFPDPSIVYVNDAFTRMTGWHAHEILGKTPRVLQGARTDRALLDRLRNDLITKQSFHGEGVNYRKDGADYYVEWRIVPLVKDGEIQYWMAIQRDVTHRKLHEERLASENRRKDTFLAMLAHELKNPLAPLRNGISLLREGSQSGDTLSIMERGVSRLVRLVDDLLDVSRFTRGLTAIKLAVADPVWIVHHAVEVIQSALDIKEQSLVLSIDNNVHSIPIDAARIEQVVINLLTNSHRYTPKGGRIHLKLIQDTFNTIIQVNDNGQGIDKEHLARVFELFYQEKGVPSADGGLGIGLTLVKQLIELHNGTVMIASEGRGCGTTVTVTIPNTQPNMVDDNRAAIMIVDDNVDNAVSLGQLVKLYGYDNYVCYNGKDAIDYYNSHRQYLSAVFLDIGLPDMSGVDVATHIRKDEDYSPVLVAITGWARPEDRKLTTKAGFNFHFSKPVDNEKIKSILTMLQ